MAPRRLRGRLLVATPVLGDPNFERTVVLLLEHNDDGAVGVVLNRPSARPVAELLPEWHDLAVEPRLVFVGGPVERIALIGLARRRATGEPGEWQPVVGGIGSVDLGRPPEDLAGEVDALRIFAGYAGWGAGQLEAEVDAGAWFPVAAAPDDDVLAAEPDSLWRRVLRRQRGPLAMYASFPPDPSRN